MHNKYVAAAALAAMLGLAACSGKPANEQAAEDAQKINLDSVIPNMVAALAANCAQGGINIGCAADKARSFIKSYPAFAKAVGEVEKKCADNYGEKICAEGYGGFLADNVADKLIIPVSEQAKEILQAKQAAERKAAQARAAAAKKAAEEAARKAREAAAEAAAKAAEEAKQAAEAAKSGAGEDAAKAAGRSAEDAGKAAGSAVKGEGAAAPAQ